MGLVEKEIEIEKLEISPQNVRKEIAENKDGLGIDELAENIKQLGLIQPILVRPKPGDKYEVVVGGLRTRACQKIGWKKIPVIIQEMDDRTAIKKSLSEHLVSTDISPLDKAKAFKKLCENRTQAEVAREFGVSPATVSNYLCLLQLTPELQAQANSTDRTSQLQTLRKIARDFKDPEEQLMVAKRLEGFSQKEALCILQRANGDVEKIDDVATDVALHSFPPGFDLCEGLENCPLIPENVRKRVLEIVQRAEKDEKHA
jgi:ParB family chromosome partitioning protein